MWFLPLPAEIPPPFQWVAKAASFSVTKHCTIPLYLYTLGVGYSQNNFSQCQDLSTSQFFSSWKSRHLATAGWAKLRCWGSQSFGKICCPEQFNLVLIIAAKYKMPIIIYYFISPLKFIIFTHPIFKLKLITCQCTRIVQPFPIGSFLLECLIF